MLLKTIKSFFSLIYPNLCCCCNQSLIGNEEIICTECQYQLPKTNFHKDRDNAVEQIFRGRVAIESAASYLYFHKGGSVQKLMHLFKYKGMHQIGSHLGKIYGNEILSSDGFSDIDIIVPVPMHPAKQRKRGYNQSEIFAKALSDSMQKPLSTKDLIKREQTGTQTKKSRFVRWENVETVFYVANSKHFENKHVLIVDDVVTTGATIESCAQKLLEIDGVKISILTLAIAS